MPTPKLDGQVLPRDPHTVSLLCRVGTRLCALPLDHVVETMRPLPVEAMADAPGFVLGLSIIRGAPVPVVDGAALVGAGTSQPTRFVTVTTNDRQVALAVDAVLGVRALPADSLLDLPPLLRDADPDVVSAIGVLDAELLLVLRRGRLVPESVWAAVDSGGSSP